MANFFNNKYFPKNIVNCFQLALCPIVIETKYLVEIIDFIISRQTVLCQREKGFGFCFLVCFFAGGGRVGVYQYDQRSISPLSSYDSAEVMLDPQWFT